MRAILSPACLAPLPFLLCVGCGTLANVTAPPGPPATTYRAFGPSTCEPMGGVERSLAMGELLLCPPYTPLGLGIIAVEVPLSFVGDLATLRLVSAINLDGEKARRETTPHAMTNDAP